MADDRIRVVIDGDASQLERELRGAGGAVTAFGRQVSGSSRGVAAFNAVADQQVRNLQALGRWSMYAAQGVGLAAGAVAAYSIKEGIQFNSTMESNKMALEQFLGSAQAADRFLNQLFETAKRGPFEFAQLTDAARKLLAFEFTKGEATKTLDAISDSVAALGGSAELIDRVVIAMGQIQAKGRVQGDELLQLAEGGIPAYQILRDELNLTADEVKNIGDAGITADQALGALVRGMEERFGGAAERQAKTFSGQMSTLRDNYSQLMGAMTEGLFEELKDWLPVVNETAEEIAAVWKRDDLTPEAKFKESRVIAERTLGPLVQELGRMLDRADLPEKFGDALAAALPIAAEGAGQLGVAIARGTVEGFLASDSWGRLLIGGWLFTKLGGIAAIRASGVLVGGAAAQGVGTGLAGGGAAGGLLGAAQGAIGSVKWARLGAIGIGAVLADGAISEFQRHMTINGDDLMASLGEQSKKSWFEGVGVKAANAFLPDAQAEWLAGADKNEAAAQRLLEIFEEIETANGQRLVDLAAEGNQLAENVEKADEVKEALRAATQPVENAEFLLAANMGNLQSGLITRMADIKRLVRDNARQIAVAWAGDPAGWRENTAKSLDAAVMAVRAGMRQGVIETAQGKREIRRLLARKDLITGADPLGLAQGFRKSWGTAGKINQSSINRIIGQLDQMPRSARNKAAQMLIQMARQMEKDRKLPEGSMSKLRSALLSNLDVTVRQGSDRIKKLQDAAGEGGRAWGRALDGFGKGTEDGMRRTNRALDRGVRDANRAMERLEERAGDLTAGVGGPFRRLPTPVGAGMSAVAGQVNQGLKAVGSDKTIKLAEGGMMRVAGQGLHDSVAVTGNDIRAMVAPGEDLVVLNRHQRPMVDAAVQQTYGVSGLGGFFNRYDRPHYMARGGIGPGSKRIDSPNLTGTPSGARGYGQGGLDMFTEAARKLLREEQAKAYAGPKGGNWSGGSGIYPGVSGDTDFMPALGQALSKMSKAAGQSIYVQSGWRSYAEQAALYAAYLNGTGNLAAAPGSSNHESGRAADITPGSEVFGGMAGRFGLGFTVPGESWHIELLKRGGFIPQFYSGGQINTVKTVGEFLMQRGFNHRAAAGVLGNAYREGLWNPSQMEYTGLDNGGLYGFTTSPVSLQDVRNFADRRGKAWDDPILQTNFMLSHGDPPGMALREEMNRANKIPKATEIFMSKWEKPGVPALSDRVRAAFDASKIMRDAGIGGGGDEPSAAELRKRERAQRRKAREKQIETLTAKARNASSPARKKALWWQVVEQYAKYGEFDMPVAFTANGGIGSRGINEKAHLLQRANQISAIADPNRGAGQLAQLADWLSDHVDITGGESEDSGLVARLGKMKDAGGERAKTKRQRIYKRMARYSKNFAGGRFLNDSLDRVAATREWIDIAESNATNAGGDGGSDYTDSELDYVTRLYQSLEGEQVGQYGLIAKWLPKALERKGKLKDKIARGRKDPKLRWKIPGWKQGLSAINQTIENMRENREVLVGVTGQGGDIFATRQRLLELGATTTTEGARQNEINSLLKEQLTESQRGFALGQAQYGVFKDFLAGMDSPFLGAFAMGTAGRRVGRTGLAVLHENEIVTPDPKGPYGQNMSTVSSGGGSPTVILNVSGDVAPLLNKVEAIVDGKNAKVIQQVNSTLGRERRQLAHAPGR